MIEKDTSLKKEAHSSVLLKEVLEYLAPKAGEKFLDCTFGAGGYSAAILESCNCKVTGVDRDPTVMTFVKNLEDKYKQRFNFIHADFGSVIENLSNSHFDGIVLDLGVSSMQIDNADRGFSFMHDGPLDMRMSKVGMSAAEFINEAAEEVIAEVIYKYGDETASRKIASKIVYERNLEPITTTDRLARIVRSAIGFRKSKIDLATKTFQAIRIFINNELEQLEHFLEKVASILAPGGRLVVVSFHSLEDSIVKYFFKQNSSKIVAQSKYAKNAPITEPGKWLKIITKKPVSPSDQELKRNVRARSAKLRAALKIEETYVS
jgi:16S rRNA (cytosine1402-N4)-methyltransferase